MTADIEDATQEKKNAEHQFGDLILWVTTSVQEQAERLDLDPEMERQIEEWSGLPPEEIVRRVAHSIQGEMEASSVVQPALAFIGPTNVGKSTLVNTLFGKTVARVSPAPGTPAIAGRLTHRMGVDVLDTRGFLGTDTGVDEEVEGLLPSMDIRVFVVDVTTFRRDDARLAHRLHQQNPLTFVVLNKIDLPPAAELPSLVDQIRGHLPQVETVQISALRGDNLDQLIKALYAALPDIRQKLLLIGWLNDRKEAIAAEIEALGQVKADAGIAAASVVEEIGIARRKAAHQAVQKAAAAAAIAGATPVPGADIIPLMALQHRLILQLAASVIGLAPRPSYS